MLGIKTTFAVETTLKDEFSNADPLSVLQEKETTTTKKTKKGGQKEDSEKELDLLKQAEKDEEQG